MSFGSFKAFEMLNCPPRREYAGKKNVRCATGVGRRTLLFRASYLGWSQLRLERERGSAAACLIVASMLWCIGAEGKAI